MQNLESCKGCKRFRGLEGFRSLVTGKRQAWTPISRFDLGKLRRRSSTPAVVPGAAPALAKAGVGGYIYI